MLSYILSRRVLVVTPVTAWPMPGSRPELAQVILVDVEIAQQNHVVLAAAVLLDADEHVGQGIQFGDRLVRDRCGCRPG